MASGATKQRKKDFLEALKNSLGVITQAADVVGLDRQTIYNWKDDPKFLIEFNDIRERAIDFVESRMFVEIAEGNGYLIWNFLKTRGKHRGYAEIELPQETEGDIIINEVRYIPPVKELNEAS